MSIEMFREVEMENELRTKESFKGCVHLFELIFNTLVDKTDLLVRHGDKPDVVLLAKAFVNSSASAFLLTKKGYYEEALTLSRRMLEIYEHLIFLFLKPEMLEEWLRGNICSQEVIKTLKKELPTSTRDIVKKSLSPLYFNLCKYAHPTGESLRSLVDPVGLRVRRLPMYVHKRCSELLMLLIMMNWLLLESLKQIFDPLLKDLKLEEIWMLIKASGDCFPPEFFKKIGME